MGYGMFFPAHQVGGQPELWDIRSYGVSGVWVKRSSTVVVNVNGVHRIVLVTSEC
jgi:hypothetical protein